MGLRRIYRKHLSYWLWRLRHPRLPFEQFYVAKVLGNIAAGRGNPALGPAARAVRSRSEVLDVLRRHGLKPDDVVVDYGCGSLRLGLPLIEHLDLGRYWGLDVTDAFYLAGVKAAPEALLRGKRPNLRVISETSLNEARFQHPRFVVSWHVCSKVPDGRLADYLGKIFGLLGPGAQALIHFPETATRKRLSRFSLSLPRAQFIAAAHAIDPALEITFAPLTAAPSKGVSQTLAVVTRPALAAGADLTLQPAAA